MIRNRLHRPLALLAALPLLTVPATAQPWDSGDSRKPDPKSPAKQPDKKKPDAKKDLRDEAKKVFGPAAGPADDNVESDKAWVIALVVTRGESAEKVASLALNKVQTEGGLPHAFLEHRGESIIVAAGRFAGADSPKAISELKRIQEMSIGGGRPYRDALLVPPMSETRMGSMPQFNLVQAKSAFGNEALYTLQVGVYGRRDLLRPTEADLADARKAAEAAAMRLRQEGEQAFYYHGPRMSTVTVGIFGIDDFDPQTPGFKSTRLLDTQKRHPYNLYNGAGIKEKRPGEPEGRLQPSNLVAIPEK